VGFRFFVSSRARTFGLCGQVWNRPDGAVEADAEGGKQALEQWLEELREGPSGARVDGVQETWGDDAPGFEGFDIVG
jgi:acylphosphatase